MLLGVLTVTAVSLLVIMLAAYMCRDRVEATIESLRAVRHDLRPAVLTVETQAQRAAALRNARAERSTDPRA